MSLTCAELFARLDTYRERVPLDVLELLLGELGEARSELLSSACFSAGHYTRTPVSLGPAYQALVLGWLPGQESVIHDHVGSSCGVLVLAGDCTEVPYRRAADGRLIAQDSRQLPLGTICGTQDSDIHKICNYGETSLVTLHVYSPPLHTMNTYNLDGACVGVQHMPVPAAAG